MDFTEQELHDFLGTSPEPSGEETPETAPEPEAEPETAPEVQEPETPEEPETTEPEAKAEEPSAGDLEAAKQAAIQPRNGRGRRRNGKHSLPGRA